MESEKIVIKNHRFEPCSPEDKDPQELWCICGAKLSKNIQENKLNLATSIGWYLLDGPYICPKDAVCE